MGETAAHGMSRVPGPAAELGPAERARVEMTVRCRDCDELPRVEGAGDVVERDGVRRQVMHNGLLVREGAYHGAWMVEVIRRLRGHHEPQEERVFAEVLKRCAPGGCMIELGCFWSYYAAWFAHAVPDGRAVMLEPDELSLGVGQDTFAANGLEGEFHLGAIGATPAPAVGFTRESDGARVQVPRFSVPSLMAAADIERVELLLADVQGAELATLEGSAEVVEAGRLRFCMISTHHHSISDDPLTHQKCLDWVRGHGGHVIAEHSVAESFSGDGLIAASFAPADRGIPEIPLTLNRASTSLFREIEYDLADAWLRDSPAGGGAG